MALGDEDRSFIGKANNRIERSCLGHSLVGDGFSFALRVGFFAGLIANLIDIDHLPMFWGGPGRMLHPPLFVLAVFVAIYCGARIGGLFAGVVLGKYRNKPRGRRHESMR